MATMVEDIGQWLEDNGHGTLAVDIFLDGLPAEGPEALVALQARTSRAPELEHDSVIAEQTPNLHVLVRAADPKSAQDKALVVQAALATIVNTTLDGRAYYAVQPISVPVSIGEDSNRRNLMSMNFEVNHAL